MKHIKLEHSTRKTCTSCYTRPATGTTYRCKRKPGHTIGEHADHDRGISWPDEHADKTPLQLGDWITNELVSGRSVSNQLLEQQFRERAPPKGKFTTSRPTTLMSAPWLRAEDFLHIKPVDSLPYGYIVAEDPPDRLADRLAKVYVHKDREGKIHRMSIPPATAHMYSMPFDERSFNEMLALINDKEPSK